MFIFLYALLYWGFTICVHVIPTKPSPCTVPHQCKPCFSTSLVTFVISFSLKPVNVYENNLTSIPQNWCYIHCFLYLVYFIKQCGKFHPVITQVKSSSFIDGKESAASSTIICTTRQDTQATGVMTLKWKRNIILVHSCCLLDHIFSWHPWFVLLVAFWIFISIL